VANREESFSQVFFEVENPHKEDVEASNFLKMKVTSVVIIERGWERRHSLEEETSCGHPVERMIPVSSSH
jgi:hypothetical protein